MLIRLVRKLLPIMQLELQQKNVLEQNRLHVKLRLNVLQQNVKLL